MTRKIRSRLFGGLLFAAAFATLVAAPLPTFADTAVAENAAIPDDAVLARELDAWLSTIFPADEPGAAILIARNGKPIYRRGFGLADVDGKVPVTPEMVFRIGSVTKQFTAAAILRLAEQGKLSIDDEITKHLPDYPTQGRIITIRHLLTHTSGIQPYTAMPAWHARINEDMTVQQIVDIFKNEPLNFEPGEGWAYNNSGYVLLGAIIEKVTGRTYAEHLKADLFVPLGMTLTGYGARTPTFPGEVYGYDMKDGKAVLAAPLSMTSPYAAGALVSSVDDLLKWDEALNAGRVLNPSSLAASFTPYTLRNGIATGYGFGWMMSEHEGHPIQQHNGGINGFLSNVMRLPADRVYVAILRNSEVPPPGGEILALKLAAEAIGRPLPKPGDFTMLPARLDDFTGVYQIDSTNTRIILREGDRLYSQRGASPKLEIFPTSDSTFAFVSRVATLTFSRNGSGTVDKVTLRQGAIVEPAPRTDKPIPEPRKVVTLPENILDSYVGHYELAPGFVLTITRAGASLMAQATGQPAFEIFPESETFFFVKVVDAQIEFQKGEDGRMSSLTLHQGGRKMPAKRIS
jgi:D-alanyl-D-alanine carboxypeptidase